MAARSRDGGVIGLCLMALVVVVVVGSIGADAHLTPDFYDDSCPQIYDIVEAEIHKQVAAEKRMAASLVRLHFHDCFVNGCDGSILLDNSSSFVSEQYSLANKDSIRGLDVIDIIKAQLEDACPQTVSCADIVAIASRDSAVEVGLSPPYPVLFGRRDSLTANISAADAFLPGPGSNYPLLVSKFEAVGLNEIDLVALSGAHTIGRVRCLLVRLFLDDTDMNAVFRENNARLCPEGGDPDKLVNLDLSTPDQFDNWYYKNLLKGEGILKSDQVLWSTPGIVNQPLVATYAVSQLAFTGQFGVSTIRMGNIKPLTGDEGEIRLNCGVVNDNDDSSAKIELVTSQ